MSGAQVSRDASDFRDAFRRSVLPALLDQCRVQGTLVALGDLDFAAAYKIVSDLARRRGAMFLRDQDLDALEDQLLSAMVAEIDAADTLRAKMEALADRKPSEFWRNVWGMQPETVTAEAKPPIDPQLVRRACRALLATDRKGDADRLAALLLTDVR